MAKALPVLPIAVERRVLWTLYACNLITAVGVWFFIPLLPIFIGRKGGSAALVGAVFAAGLLANAAIRYPAGWAADRYGTRVVMVVAMAAYAALFLAYLLPLPVGLLVAVRFFQGGAAGAFWPAANGLIADATEPRQRGRAFGLMQATNMAGMLVGPAAGGFIALFNLNAVMAISAGICGVAAAALATLPGAHAGRPDEPPLPTARIMRALVPLVLFGAGVSYMIGTFDTIWPLYMTYHGATTFEVGISFTVFAIPAVVFSAQSGVLGEWIGARRLIVASLVATAAFSIAYPFISSVPWLIGLGALESALTMAGFPTLMAEVSRTAPAGQQGRTQGMYQTVQVAIQIAGALGGGSLFAINPGYAFWAISAVCLLGASTALLPRLQPRRSAGAAKAEV